MGPTGVSIRVETRMFQRAQTCSFQRVGEVWAGCEDVGVGQGAVGWGGRTGTEPPPLVSVRTDGPLCQGFAVYIHGVGFGFKSLDAF